MSYSYTDIRGGKGNPSIVKFARGTQEQFDKLDKTGMIKPDLYMKNDTLYLVIPDDTKPIKVKYDETSGTSALVDKGVKSKSIEENPFLQESIDII